ncbi:MAG: hypothetical protein IPG93_03160 [Burkholderiales bacterium]|nr:hypothetical protein [Burkholderiales bacterium]
MKSMCTAIVLATLGLTSAGTASAGDDFLKFSGGIGSTPFANNIVHGVAAGGQPWVIRKFRATISEEGKVSARGSGLLLGGGNNIGLSGGPRNVLVSLFCNADATTTPPTPPTVTHSPAAPLDARGNFSIKGSFSDPVPNPCAAPVLLVRTVSATTGLPGAWFAAGIPGGDDD